MHDSNYPPVSRNTDIESSKNAERQINRSGMRSTHQQMLMELVIKHGGLTSKEMTMFCDLDRYQIARRLSDLENLGLVKKGAIRDCRIGKRKATTWWRS